MPYTGYENFKFNVPVSNAGDVYARYLVRVQELRESQKIATQALEGMPEGSTKADAPKVVLPDREKMKTQMEALIYHFKIVSPYPRERCTCRSSRRAARWATTW
jgi:NADH-quinone oxidoreductase subunit D